MSDAARLLTCQFRRTARVSRRRVQSGSTLRSRRPLGVESDRLKLDVVRFRILPAENDARFNYSCW